MAGTGRTGDGYVDAASTRLLRREAIELPANLSPDLYFLKATVKDLQANRVDEQTIRFEVTGKLPPTS